MAIKRLTLCLFATVVCVGCGTITNHPDKGSVFYPRRIAYGGVRMDWGLGTCTDIGCGPWWFLDVPFSAVFDTLCLPSDLYTKQKWDHDVKAYQESLKRNPPDPDPLAGWKCDFEVPPDKAIVDDYQKYIETLPPEQKNTFIMSVYMVQLFEDGSGQHAMRIKIAVDSHTLWKHVLIYDASDKRIKTLKYENDHLCS